MKNDATRITNRPTFSMNLNSVVVVDAEERASAIARGLRAAARKSRAPTVFVSGGGGFRARKGARLFFYGLIASFVFLFFVPTAAVSIYYAFIASDQYATETRFSLKAGGSSALDSLSGIAGIGGFRTEPELAGHRGVHRKPRDGRGH